MSVVAAFTEKGVTLDPDMPVFLPRPSNVTFHRGDTATLPCAIDNVGTKTVSVAFKSSALSFSLVGCMVGWFVVFCLFLFLIMCLFCFC